MTTPLVRSLLLCLVALLIAPRLLSADPLLRAAEEALSVRVVVHEARADQRKVVVKVLGDDDEVIRTIASTAPTLLSIAPAPPAGAVLIAEAVGFWSTRTEAPPAAGGAEVVISLWPLATVRARLAVPRGTSLPDSVALRIGSSAVAGRSAAGSLEPTTIDCPVDDDGRLRCSVPALAAADLRLRVPGFASRFFWAIELTPGEIQDVGPLRLEPGGSVIGRVEAPPPIDLRDVVIALEPAPGSPYEEPREGGVVHQEVRPDRRGFFALEGLAAGIYRLLVEHPEIERFEVGPVRVADGAQTELPEPVVLRRAEKLRLSIQPPFDPFGEDWAVRFDRIEAPGRRSPKAAAETAATAGFVAGIALAPGPYHVTVLDSRGTRLAETRVEHEAGDELHTLEVEAVRLDGTVRLGDEPLVAKLTFQGPTGAIEMESDAEGRFGGALPRAGRWDIEIDAPIPPVEWRRMVDLETDAGAARLDLVLPDTLVEGLVLDEDGRPVPEAEVTLHQPLQSESIPTTRQSDAEGRFRFHGLGEGTYRAEAQAGPELASVPVAVEISEDRPVADLRLVLQRRGFLRGRLINPAGEALPGAGFAAFSYAADGRLLIDPIAGDVSTDAAGRFDVSLPPETATVRLTAMAPGFALRSWSVPPGDAGDLVVQPLGGTLVVELPAPLAAVDWKGPLRPMLFDGEGYPLPLPQLAQWAQTNGVEFSMDSSRLAVPALGPGTYRLCWTRGEDLARVGTPATGCAAGQLTAGGGLTLRLDAPPDR